MAGKFKFTILSFFSENWFFLDRIWNFLTVCWIVLCNFFTYPPCFPSCCNNFRPNIRKKGPTSITVCSFLQSNQKYQFKICRSTRSSSSHMNFGKVWVTKRAKRELGLLRPLSLANFNSVKAFSLHLTLGQKSTFIHKFTCSKLHNSRNFLTKISYFTKVTLFQISNSSEFMNKKCDFSPVWYLTWKANDLS